MITFDSQHSDFSSNNSSRISQSLLNYQPKWSTTIKNAYKNIKLRIPDYLKNLDNKNNTNSNPNLCHAIIAFLLLILSYLSFTVFIDPTCQLSDPLKCLDAVILKKYQ